MDTPEIRDYVAQFLDRRELAVAARVCKSWNRMFTPFLYRQIVLSAYHRDIAMEPLKANANHVRSLKIMEFFQNCLRARSKNFPLEAFTRLTSLTLSFHRMDPPYLMLTRVVQMLPQNPAIQDLTIYGYITHPYNMEFMQTVASSCPNLQTLSVFDSSLDVECTKLLFDICVRLTALILQNTALDGALGTEDVDRWPDGFPKLSSLTLEQHDLDPSVQSSLTRHFPHLTHVDFLSRRFLQSAFVHQILISCPHLDHFSAYRLHVYDILGVPDLRLRESGPEFLELESRTDGIRPQEWVCTKLRTLVVSLDSRTSRPCGTDWFWNNLVGWPNWRYWTSITRGGVFHSRMDCACDWEQDLICCLG
ncbi:hypothetical protein B0O80DRAFT_428685 [Mortierella sp. GBAus27b]|nr:hypothetical protein B0O80DRAFT_428685 [Mortierella sp. GBAus27b]